MTLYIPHSIFHSARLLYVGPETFGPYYVATYFNDGSEGDAIPGLAWWTCITSL